MSQTLDRALPAARLPRLPASVLVVVIVAAAAAAGFAITPHAATAQAITSAGPELTRLLRAMALLKTAIAAACAWFVLWRFKYPTSRPRAAAYFAALAAMAAGPGLIWGMAHIVPGAILLHAGLAAFLVIAWQDPGSPAMLPRRRT